MLSQSEIFNILDEELRLSSPLRQGGLFSAMELEENAEQEAKKRAGKIYNPTPIDWANNNLFAPFGLGALNMANNTVTGGLGYLLGNLGRLSEWVSPFSGRDEKAVEELKRLGASDEYINQVAPQEDSYLTSAAKSVFSGHNYLDDILNNAKNEIMGDNPTLPAKMAEGAGSGIGYMLTMLAMRANPLLGALTAGAGEALTEAGSFMGDAYRNGQYDDGALSAANKGFLANMALNTGLNYLFSPYGKLTGKIANPVGRYLAGTGSEVLNELLQEPSQQVIEQAAKNSLNNGTGFLSELGESVKQWPETFAQLAPEVAGSTLITQALLSPLGLKANYAYNNQYENAQRQANQMRQQLESMKNNLTENQNEEFSKLQNDSDEILSRINKLGYNNPGDLEKSLIHLNNLQNAINNFGKDAETIKNEKQAEATIQAATNTAPIIQPEQVQTPIENISPLPVSEPKNDAQLDFGITDTFNPKERNAQKNKVEPQHIEISEAPEILTENISPLMPETPSNRNITRIRTMKGTEVDTRYRVIEADDLITSTKENGSPNPNYPQELQPRQRNRSASREQIDKIARTLDPELLAENRLASDGAPVVGPDKVVESGNGRVMGIRQAYKWNRADNYKNWVINNAARFGLNSEYISKMKEPVLVRERISDVDRVKFTSEANESSIASMSASEHALDDAKQITEDMLADFNMEQSFEANKNFIGRIIWRLPQNERGDLIQKNGSPSKAGIERVKYALVAKAYNDATILDRLAELPDDDIKNVSNALLQAAPKIAVFENSDIRPELSIRNDIMQAVNIVARLKKNGEKVDEYLSTIDLFSDEVSPQARRLIKFFGDNMRSSNIMSNGLNNYAEAALNEARAGQKVLFSDSIRTKEQILNEAIKEAEKDKQKKVLSPEEQLRQDFKQQILDVGRSNDEAEMLSHLYLTANKSFAKYTGQSLEDTIKADNLKFRYEPDIEIKNQNGETIGEARARTEFLPEQRDMFGEIAREAQTIIKVSQMANQSSILHEMGHLFFNKYKRLHQAGMLKGMAKHDFYTLLKSYGVSENDFNESTEAWHEAHEKFATDFERYLITGKAPSSQLKHVFEAFKRWLTDIYHSIKNIKYVGYDGREHAFELSPEVKEVFDHMLGENNSAINSDLGSKNSSKLTDIVDNSEDFINSDKNINGLNLSFNPKELRTENGHTIEEAEPSEMLVTPDGSKVFGVIDKKTANVAGIPEGNIQIDIEGLLHTKLNRHNKEILNAGYPNVETFFIDVLRNYNKIYQGSNDSLLLVKTLTKNNGVAAIELIPNKKGTYLVQTGWIVRDRGLKNKKLLFSRSEPTDTSPVTDEVLQTESNKTGETASNALLKSNENSLSENKNLVNTKNSKEIADIESYNQILGEKGARELDKQEGNTNRMDNLSIAKEMTEAGKDAKTVRLATGWEKGMDGKWRWEIMDGEINQEALEEKLDSILPTISDNPDADPDNGDYKLPHLSDFFYAPELYKAYPELKNMEVDFFTDEGVEKSEWGTTPMAFYNVTSKRIALNVLTAYNFYSDIDNREILIHEIQHAIQNIEGFLPEDIDDNPKDYNEYAQQYPEIEARNAQRRKDFTKKQRQNTLLSDTEDVERDTQIESYDQAIAADDKTINSQEQIDAVRQKYKGTDKWLKAPNGEKSNLGEKQWLQVRTENFKKWFGDWEMIANARPTLIAKTREEAAKILNNLRGKELKSEAENISATISKDGREKMVSGVAMAKSLKNGFSRAEHFTAVANIEKLFANSIKSNERADDNGQLKAIEHFSSLLMLEDDTPALATFTVKVTENAGRKIYSIEVMNLSRVEGMLPENAVKAHRASSTPDLLNISRIADAFNNASKAVNKNGEPLVVYRGSRKKGIRIFDNKKGTFSTSSYYVAESYATGGEVYPFFVNMKNPYIYEGNGRHWDKLGKNNNLSTDDIVKEIFSNSENEYDGIIFKNIIDNDGFVWDGSEESDVFVTKNPEQVKSATSNIGKFDSNNPDIYYQISFNPRKWFSNWLHGKDIDEREKKARENLTSSADAQNNNNYSFENEDTERRYSEAKNGIQRPNVSQRVKRTTLQLLRSMRGDFPELAGNEDFIFAREQFRMLGRKKSAQVHEAMKTFTENLSRLSKRQNDLFARKRLLDDLMWRKKQVPDAELPFAFTDESLRKEHEKFSKLVENDPIVQKAIQAEEQTMQKISKEFADVAGQLGLKLDNVFKNPHYYRHSILEYANAAAVGAKHSYTDTDIKNGQTLQDAVNKSLNDIVNRSWLKKYKGSSLDINADYVQAMGEVRAQMLMDIETMKTLIEIKKRYDIAPKLRDKIKQAFVSQNGNETHNQGEGINLSDIIPEGYEFYTPAGSRLIQSANTPVENVMAMALADASETSGVPIDEILNIAGLDDKEIFNQFWVIPKEIKESLKKMAKGRDRGLLGNTAKKITTGWKLNTLFVPTRFLKYNSRNFTGDLDALIAGNPEAIKFADRALKELISHFRGKETSKDLKDFLIRSGGELKIETMNFSDKEIQQLDRLAAESKKNPSLIGKSWGLVKKFFAKEVQLTQLRENWLRYAAYLAYKEDLDKNNGTPSTWGASNKDEVMVHLDNRDKAYKMSNDLLGNYDEISDVGKNLRDMLIPFWSWQEVNIKRSYRLIRNGLKGDNAGNFTKRLLIAQTAKVPFYAVNGVMTFAKISALTMMIQAFNRFIFGDDDDELPNDVKYRPHITLGKYGGKVYYFDRIGALADAADWFALDSAFLDAKEIMSGQQSLGGYVKKMLQAPVSKVIGQLNPMLKMPIELATGRSLYPDAFNSRTIRDSGQYVAQTLGLSWPYKAIKGTPRSDADELTNLLLYSLDPDEAAYFQTLDKVRQFQERVLDKHFDGFATTKRGNVLRNLKTALRYKDRAAVRRYLQEYAKLDGTKKGLQQSMKAMNPLHGLSNEEKKQFLKWITADDRKYLRKADRYFHALADRYLK